MGRRQCEIEGYEHTYFEVGQKWMTRGGSVVEIDRVFEDKTLTWPIEVGVTSYMLNGREFKNREGKKDLLTLVVAGVDEITEPVDEPIDEQVDVPIDEQVVEPVDEDLWEYTDNAGLKLEDLHKFTLPVPSVEDKMVDILIQLLQQRDRDLEKLSLVFDTFIKMEKMK